MLARLSRRQVWTIVGVGWIVAAASTIVILTQGARAIPIVQRTSLREERPQADWLVGSWEWNSISPDVKYVETFAADGSWALRVDGYTPKGPTRAWWSTLASDEHSCVVVFREDRIADNGPLRTFSFDGVNTIQETSGNMLNLKTLSRVK